MLFIELQGELIESDQFILTLFVEVFHCKKTWVCDQVRLKSACTATETSENIEILYLPSLLYQEMNNKRH